MEFGIFNGLYVPRSMTDAEGRGAEHRRFMDEVAWVRTADVSGFKYLWATEHHFLDEYSHLSANESFLGYCAAATRNMHVGSGIFNITPPVNHPARVAERVAVLDHLSEGRFEFGMGRGSSTTEQMGFGIDDPDSTKEMFDEVIPQFRRMWAETTYSFDGRFFSMPARNVLPKPYTAPHPPMWVAAGSPGTFEKAARMGVGVLCFTTGPSQQLAPLIETYKREIVNAEPVGDYVNDNVMVTSGMLCLEDGRRAREALLATDDNRHKSLLFRYLDTFPRPPGIPVWPELTPKMSAEELEAAIQMAEYCVGDPDEVTRAVQTYADIGADQLTFGMLSTNLPIEIALEATETFGRLVLPKFDTDPVHRTVRQREAQADRSHSGVGTASAD